jgi:hypothetical protein
MPENPEYPFDWMPLAVGDITVVGWDGYSYIDTLGRTYWSGAAEPSAEDATDVITNPARQLGPRKAALRQRLALRRWEVETGGLTLAGVVIATDDRSQAKLAGAVILANLEDQLVVDWKAATGWEQLGEDGVRALAIEVGRHVQRCFTRERALAEEIDAATTPAQLDALAAEIETFALPQS